MNTFTFNGQSSSAFGLHISGKDIFKTPKRKLELIQVPGRSGDVLIDYDSYENVDISFDVGLSSVNSRINDIADWLCVGGYKELSNTYQSGVFRKACFNSQMDVTEMLNNFGTAHLSFNCKPYLYLDSGKTETSLYTSSRKDITNPTKHSALPIIKLVGHHDITINFAVSGQATKTFLVHLPTTASTVYVDSELMTIYEENNGIRTPVDGAIGFNYFPELAGNKTTTISFTKGTGAALTSASIVPNWRRL